MNAGPFAEWQPRYAACGISTFPVRGKTPAVRGYLRVSPATSRKLAEKYGDATAFGLALKPANIVVLDVDTPDERILEVALERHGATPFVVRSGSGNFQAWYRRQHEGRRIRPDPNVPVDILGDGYVVAPPSMGERGPYRIIHGTLADLVQLPVLGNAPASEKITCWSVGPGHRNTTLWRHCMRMARHCDDHDALLDVARTRNAEFAPPLADDEVIKVASSAWDHTEGDQNWFGSGRRVVTTHDEIDELLQEHPDAFNLLLILRRHHSDGEFVIANAMADSMPGGGWRRQRLAAARQHLVEVGEIALVRSASKWQGAATYRFKGGQS